MCHCFGDVTDLTETERTELLDAHSERELRAAYTADELDALGMEA